MLSSVRTRLARGCVRANIRGSRCKRGRVLRARSTSDDLVERAENALARAREALTAVQTDQQLADTAVPAFIPQSLTFGAPLQQQSQQSPSSDSGRLPSERTTSTTATGPARDNVRSSEAAVQRARLDVGEVFRGGQAPAGRTALQQQQQQQQQPQPESLPFKEAVAEELKLKYETDGEEAEPETLASVLKLTSAHLPPSQTDSETAADETPAEWQQARSSPGSALQDGSGTLPDGSTWERISGEEKGENGYWCRWWVLRGTALGGQVRWEETSWETSDWSGLREMGAQKVGCNVSGDAWREAWTEKVYYDQVSGEPFVERNAHKWATDQLKGDEWEEKWAEKYGAGGYVNKWADKWGRHGSHIWHEKWGEDYSKRGDACTKWTDRWSEHEGEDGSWHVTGGDKWQEEFSGGKGHKHGETYHREADGSQYHRHWGENHFGDGWVQKFGHSTSGEQWDASEQTGTYYNPNPHFNFQMAVDHSPDLLRIPVRAKESSAEELLHGGFDDF